MASLREVLAAGSDADLALTAADLAYADAKTWARERHDAKMATINQAYQAALAAARDEFADSTLVADRAYTTDLADAEQGYAAALAAIRARAGL